MTMADYVLKIIDDKAKLSDRADEILKGDSPESVTRLINDLKDTLRANKDLCALAAPQIGSGKRVFCIKFANGDIRAFLNPMVMTHSKGMHLSRETCASLGATEYIIPRYDEVTVGYQTPMGVPESNIFKGAPAEVFQQMCELLDGILLDDYGLLLEKGFDDLNKKDKNTIIDMYLNWLEAKSSNMRKEIDESPSMKEKDRAIDFEYELAMGNVKIEKLTKEEEDRLNDNIKKEAERIKAEAGGE